MEYIKASIIAALFLFGAVSYLKISTKYDMDQVCDSKPTVQERNLCRFAMSGAGY